MRAVNLLPHDLERQGGQLGGRVVVYVAAGGFAAVTAVLVVLFLSASGSVSDQRTALDSARAALAAVPRPGAPSVAPEAISQERADRVAALSAALTTRLPLDRLLRELSYVLPDDAWLTGLSATAPESDGGTTSPGSAPAASATPGVTIEGATYSNRSVARVLARLATLPSIDDVRLTTTARVEPVAKVDAKSPTAKAKANKKQEKKQRTVVTFAIAASLRAGSGS
jgi:Tfp pilus assembly protein PilN